MDYATLEPDDAHNRGRATEALLTRPSVISSSDSKHLEKNGGSFMMHKRVAPSESQYTHKTIEEQLSDIASIAKETEKYVPRKPVPIEEAPTPAP